MILKESEFNKECGCGTGLRFGECCGKAVIQMAAEAAYREKFPSPRSISTKSGKYRVRAGFEIEWIRNSQSKKHCEFNAIHKVTKEVIAVEAKSRRRPGVYHQKGDLPDLGIMEADIFSLYNEAMLQNPGDKPFGVFIDINLPSQRDRTTLERDWIKDLLLKIDRKERHVFGSPPPAFVGITNSGWFYEGKTPAGSGESLAFVLLDAHHPLKCSLTGEALHEALKLFRIIPDEDV